MNLSLFYCVGYLQAAAVMFCQIVRIAVIRKNIPEPFRELNSGCDFDGLKLVVGELMGLSVEVGEFISNLNIYIPLSC
jgi:hypothetical protein